MPALLRLRTATAGDTTRMLTILKSALSESAFHNRCFPPSDPESQQQYVGWIQKNLADPNSRVIVAEKSTSESPVLGWARWVCRPPSRDAKSAPPPMVFSEEMFPSKGEPKLAARFFQSNFDAMTRAIGPAGAMWFLSMLIVPKDLPEKNIAEDALVKYGVERADSEGWPAYVNSTPETLALYNRFGFKTVEKSDFGDGLFTEHMKREPRS